MVEHLTSCGVMRPSPRRSCRRRSGGSRGCARRSRSSRRAMPGLAAAGESPDGADAGALYAEHRPRPLVVGAASCRSASGRSTSTGSTRTSASSCRSSSRCCSSGTSRAASACSTRSPAPGRRSSRRSRAGSTRPACDVAAFNCLLMRVKTGAVRPVRARARAARRSARGFEAGDGPAATPIGVRARAGTRRRPPPSCCASGRSPSDYEHADVLRVVLARAARSARRTTHFDLDFPREPQLEPYWCHKHRRECRPGRVGAPVPAAVHARHARAAQGVRARARARRSADVAARRRARGRVRRAVRRASSRRRRTRA